MESNGGTGDDEAHRVSIPYEREGAWKANLLGNHHL